MMKKFFALASISAVAGVIAAGAMVGCSSDTTNSETTDAGETTDAAKPDSGKGKDGGGVDAQPEPTIEEKTVGKECTTNADCEVANAVGDNGCSMGGFKGGDLFGTPVCIQEACTPAGANDTLDKAFCDDGPGFCLPNSASTGICLPLCVYGSDKIEDPGCAGGNKCQAYYIGSDSSGTVAVGFCSWACQADTDCKGTPGQKCQKETGMCLTAPTAYTKKLGDSCADPSTSTPSTECECNTVGGTSADKLKGVCSHQCITGAAGDAVCAAAGTDTAGWKCTTKLPTKDSKGNAAFTKQIDNVAGTCALPCKVAADCTALSTSLGLSTPMTCEEFAGGSFCQLP
ncbi:hypothetical protein AKJ09_07613 [Labilithrix luteola]|uniref:Tryptophan synthase alpha chain n=1 Tax=Labilithrix luteola TaxID=1391654 RepID=A0A0K1Q6B0_9BACT|nr:hypothetical protein [Labilithrix luteola]AKV00950.1 hypothetical protein AKJ09_07613 [Labilithrix luteola]